MNFISLMASTGSTGTTTTSQNPLSFVLIMGVMIAFMYFTMIRPQKKKQKEEQEMRDSLQVGDEITTIGGIVGRVVTVKDDSLVIETGAGSERNKMKIMRWAISSNNTANEKLEAERKAAKEAAEAEKQKKMEEAAENSKSRRKKSKKKDDTFDN